MKKLLMVLAATAICGTCLFTSCKKDDNLHLEENIIGKWMFAERNGEPTPTNKKRVFTFVSTTKAYVSASRNTETASGGIWVNHSEADVVISGNKVTITMTKYPSTSWTATCSAPAGETTARRTASGGKSPLMQAE